MGDVIVALSVTTTGETHPVSGMRMREGWIYCCENAGTRPYVHANTNFRPPNGAPIDFPVCHFMNLVVSFPSTWLTRVFEAYDIYSVGLERSVITKLIPEQVAGIGNKPDGFKRNAKPKILSYPINLCNFLLIVVS